MILVLEPCYDSLTSSCAYNMEIRFKELDLTITQPAQKQVIRPYSLISRNGLTPVDPAGPDCYQSGTKPCEST